MIKKLLTPGLALFLFTLPVSAQQLQNSSFETFGAANTYSLNDPQNWGALNFDAFAFPQTTSQSTTAPFHGASNVLMTTSPGHAGLGIDDVIGGAVFYDFDPFVEIGTPYTSRPMSIAFNYKSNMVNNDTGWVYLALTKWNGTSQITVGEALAFIGDNQSAWTSMNLPVNYYTGDTPDSVVVIAQSSAGSWPFYIITQPAQAGSSLQLDAIVICDSIQVGFTQSVNGMTVDFTSSTVATGNSGMGTLDWDFGDGNNSSSINPSHTYSADGAYGVTLTVTDSCGNTATYMDSVVINTSGLYAGFLAESTVSLYPNPTSGILTVDIALKEVVEFSVILSDISGREIRQLYYDKSNGTQIQVNTEEFLSGSYYVVIRSGNGNKITKKLIIQ